ncbi:UPF0449 protein C19orf25 homolog [Syngnathoides biaculeatus]|uniref:UPF0449 protein C19orf25 homolog n=1 Tax=Syngnathoides biaculeatus TaxID=300417 RepID=UPI002ADD54F5|nr:UPF0449 protein C19orf25 homolog [Syngnathoides biaculeatus]
MNVSLKSKKRAVLPSRPSPPSADRILEDVGGAEPGDPVFSVLRLPRRAGDPGEAERTFRQCRRLADLKRQLREAETLLRRQRDHLRETARRLDRDVAEVKSGLG